MLDDLSKKILKFMQTDSEAPSQRYYDFDDDLDKMAAALSSDTESVRASVRYLEENGYIKYQHTTSGHVIRFYLDHKGLHSSEFNRIEFIAFLKKSVLTPIIVAALTSILTVNLWPWIVTLLKTMLSQTQ